MIQRQHKVRFNMLISSFHPDLEDQISPVKGNSNKCRKRRSGSCNKAVLHFSFPMTSLKVREVPELKAMAVGNTFFHWGCLSRKFHMHAATCSIHSRWRYKAGKFLSFFWMEVKDSSTSGNLLVLFLALHQSSHTECGVVYKQYLPWFSITLSSSWFTPH